MTIVSNLCGRVCCHRADHALIGTALAPVELPRMKASRGGVRQIERDCGVAALRRGSHGRRAAHLYCAGEIGRSGQGTMPAGVQIFVLSGHRYRIVVAERITGAECESGDREQEKPRIEHVPPEGRCCKKLGAAGARGGKGPALLTKWLINSTLY